MRNKILTIEDIVNLVKPIAEKYHVQKIYLFGSYARGEGIRWKGIQAHNGICACRRFKGSVE